jgi:hypothetical protein
MVDEFSKLINIGKEQKIQDWFLMELYNTGTDLTKLKASAGLRNYTMYPGWNKENLGSNYVRIGFHYDLVMGFGRKVLGYDEKELVSDGRSKALGKKAHDIGTIAYGAKYALVKKGYLSFGPQKMIYGGELFLSQKGAERAKILKKSKMKLNPIRISRLKKLIDVYNKEETVIVA